ncbi:Retrovirus-related Pol polyprotein from transposon opus [Gossypium australe]|uniref:Retrovirus-related Pol polyprotein from transposon opus n=1 Tax=Gossypium australe TaxID=47621 RepID=A0A5B6UVK4_9ROSI|nr:Retrovirus-related Pol polyprotein from transposon opus [Gossypium australe]
MPMFIFMKLRIRKARPTTVMLQLADRSYAYLKDYIILESEADKEVALIRGRPFLATGRTLIDVQKGELTMRDTDQQIIFNVFDAMKCADKDEDCHTIGIIDTAVQEELAEFFSNNYDIEADSVQFTKEELIEEFSELMEAKKLENGTRRGFESLNLSEHSFKPPQPSIEGPPTLELKPLQLHLK